MSKLTSKAARKRRHMRVRKKVSGAPGKERLCVFRSLKHFRAQVIDDTTGTALCCVSTLSPAFKEKNPNGGNMEAARLVGGMLAQKCREKGIERVVFDRGGYAYHGRVKAFAEGARSGGLVF